MTSGEAVGYVRVRILGRDPLVDERMLRLQSQRILRECARLGWTLDELFVDRKRPAEGSAYPALGAALELLDQRRHQALVVAAFDQLGGSSSDFRPLTALAQAGGWQLVVAR
jgi:DNA invertase Pin-like site-specific DNA recombinase